MKRMFLFSLAGMTLFLSASAQDAARYAQPQNGFQQGVRLYEEGRYAAAKRCFSRVERDMSDARLDHEYFRSEAMFYKAMCDVYLYHRNGASSLQDFVLAYPASNRVNDAYFQLANFEYDNKRFREAVNYYDKVDVAELNSKDGDVDKYYFRKGYASFMSKDYADAKLCFSRLKDVQGRYQVVSTYYYAYILYTEGHNQSALQEFEKIKDDNAFKSIVPLYIVQIYHVLGESDKVIEMGPALLENANDKRSAEISRMIGEAYYRKGEYRQALSYMNNFFRHSAVVPDAEGRYIIGYCYYKQAYYDSAAYHFQGMLSLHPEKALRQSGLYHLAYCYVNQNQKKFAMDAFSEAASIKGVNPVLEEDAMYHSAQLAYELSLVPYHESLAVMEKFLEEYPQSVYSKRIYSYMVRMYLTTRNYDKALQAISKIKDPTPELNMAKQRLMFNKGVESFNRMAYATALDYFEQCAANGYDENITIRAYFWQGECNYMARNFKKAQSLYQKFLSHPGAVRQPEYGKALYSQGYAYMELVNFTEAARSFEKYVALPTADQEHAYKADAWVRLGDCRYMLERYPAALTAYRNGLDARYPQSDYVELQMALCYGAQGEYQKKVDILANIEGKYPQSSLMSKIYMEMASTYLALDNSEKSLQYYRKIRDYYPNTPMALTAWEKMGLIYFNQGKNEDALRCFKHVAETNPSTEPGRQSLISIRNIYMSMNRIDEYFTYVRNLPNMKLEDAEQDSLLYATAENQFLDENYQVAINGFKDYLDKYPSGIFHVDAWKNAAVCAEQIGDKENMKRAYTQLSSFPIAEAEMATRKVADLYYADKEYKSALGYYRKLGRMTQDKDNAIAAKVGEVRCLRVLSMPKDLIEAGLQLLRMEDVPLAQVEETRYFMAQAAPSIGENDLARQQYEYLAKSTNPDYSSEALYYMLEQRVKSGFLDEAEKLIFEYISKASINDYYLAKTYLLWADIYYQRGNILQAKQTLQSIVDNYEGEDLRNMARQKLEMIAQKEAQDIKAEEEFRSSQYSDDEEIILPAM